MTERPILFSGPMVRALLDGTKTQTRRVLKPQPRGDVASLVNIGTLVDTGRALFAAHDVMRQPVNAFPIGKHSVKDDIACPYGATGDRLWVRESCFIDDRREVIFRANGTTYAAHYKSTPSIHMPRWACRLVLEVTRVRVERLQDISNDDAKAEGVHGTDWGHGMDYGGDANYVPVYRALWDDLNAARGFGWDANPWVWVVTFRRANGQL